MIRMVDRDDIIESVSQFLKVSLESKNYHRITRTKEELEDNLETILTKIQEWFHLEKELDDWKIFRPSQEKSLFHQSWSLKKTVLYIKSALKSICYEMVYNSFPGNKIITITDLTAENPITIHKNEPPKPFKVSKGRFHLCFTLEGDDEIEFE